MSLIVQIIFIIIHLDGGGGGEKPIVAKTEKLHVAKDRKSGT